MSGIISSASARLTAPSLKAIEGLPIEVGSSGVAKTGCDAVDRQEQCSLQERIVAICVP